MLFCNEMTAHKIIAHQKSSESERLNQRDLPVLLSAVHGARQEEVIDHRLTDREWAEEWKHLDNVRINQAR